MFDTFMRSRIVSFGAANVALLTMAAMAALSVRSGSLPFTRSAELTANKRFWRTHSNRRERPPAFAMQKVVGSSPIIRSQKAAANSAVFAFLARM
jgi:hypothetical protein